MKHNSLTMIGKLGQSLWLDYIRRGLISSGEFRRLIEEDGVRGITSNPAIFEKAIAESHDYDKDIWDMTLDGKRIVQIYDALAWSDVQSAADELRPLYEASGGADGYACLEVDPHLAHDTSSTVAEARRLWTALDRPNAMIKVPATAEGLPAIAQLIGEGINVNATLLFGLPRHREVAEAYIAGLETRVAQGRPIERVASVASFFVSRIDTLIDPLLETIVGEHIAESGTAQLIRGEVATACAKVAYRRHKEIFGGGGRFEKLRGMGARPQRLLWASVSVKNPLYSGVKYIDALIGQDTVVTVPLEALEVYRDSGDPEPRLEQDVEKAYWVLEQLPKLGIDIEKATQQLEDEGVAKFNQAFERLLAALARTAAYRARKAA